MMRWGAAAAVPLMISALASTAAADKDRFEIGEQVKSFSLKVVNPEDVGERYVGVDRYTGPTAQERKKAVLLSFFATYCEPCKREMPFLAALYDRYRDKGLMILSVSIDKEADKIELLKQLAKQSGVKFPVLSDRFNIVAKRYYISKLPCVYLVGADGKVAMVNVGYNEDITRALLDSIRKAVGEPATDPVPPELAAFLDGHGGGRDVAGDPPAPPEAVPGPQSSPAQQAVQQTVTDGGSDAGGDVQQASGRKHKGRKARLKRRRHRRAKRAR